MAVFVEHPLAFLGSAELVDEDNIVDWCSAAGMASR